MFCYIYVHVLDTVIYAILFWWPLLNFAVRVSNSSAAPDALKSIIKTRLRLIGLSDGVRQAGRQTDRDVELRESYTLYMYI